MPNKFINTVLNHKHAFLVLSVLVAIFSAIALLNTSNADKHHDYENKLSYYIDHQYFRLNESAEKIANSIGKTNREIFWQSTPSSTDLLDFTCFIYKADTLWYWNTHTVDQVNPQIFNSQGDTIMHLNNGIYLLHQLNLEDWTINLLTNIQSEYVVENNFLETKINEQLNLNGKLSLVNSADKIKPDETIIEKNGIYKIIYTPDPNIIASPEFKIFLLVLQIIFFLFFIVWLHKLINNNKYFKNRPWSSFLLLAMITFILRWILAISIPSQSECCIAVSEIVSPIFLFETIADIITNLFIVCVLTVIVLYNVKRLSNDESKKINIVVFYPLSLIFLSFLYHFLFRLILDNDFSTELDVMLNINSAWQILMITWLVNAAAFIILMTITLVVLSKKGKIITLSVAFISALLINILLDKDVYNSTMAAWSVVTIILFISLFTNKLQSNILSTFIILLLTAGFSAYQINQALHQKTRQLQEFTATMLAQKNDPLMEYQLSSTLKKMKADLKLMELTQSPSLVSTDTIENYINTKYIGSDFNSYNIQITICDSTDFLDIPDQNDFISCFQFFKDLVNNSGNLVQDSLLYNITTSTENIYYLGQINFANNKTIFLEFVSSYVPEGLGYPELIIDQKAQTFNLTNTSYARYFNQTLEYKFGDYKYPILMPPISNNEEKSGYYYSNGYQHYTIHINDNETITVSVPTKTVSEILFPFSILFLLFTISVAIGYLLIYLFSNKNSKTISFRTKLQFFIIGTIIFTTILLALVTMIFMQNNSDLTTQKQLEEKSYSVFIELQHKLGDVIDFSETENMMLENLLKKFSLVFFSDINLYTPEGLLAATSRPEMEQKGLLSNMINPDAYKALIIDHQLSFITKEKIGKLSFYSAYLPLFLSENKPAAIINLPFFARQSEIVHTFSALLANFINIALLIAIIGTILSIVLARLLTKPLLMLQQRMADVDIDKPNQSIFWKNNDEIGQLIAQYNQMVEKLEVSAELLKNSERESTWREMARQIAHEIKNPLTPMKLNVQYLEKAYLEKQPDFPDRLTRTTKLLIEQIETLNNVADMFGEVASSRLKETKVINMKELISGVVELFNNNPDITFVIDFSKPHCLIEAVEKDIIRVMNNLIKNAVQSFTDQANKTIKVSCQCQNNQVTISVKDNGKGISEEIQLNIFKPYFTTKTSGTGLGLAIVKSIVGENKGHITFVSHPGKGSTFKMVFPVVDSSKPISSES